MGKLRQYGVIAVGVAFLLILTGTARAASYTVNASGGADYTDLNAALAQINTDAGGGDTSASVQFTDSVATTYTLNPGETTMADGLHLTFSATTAGVVSISGRMDLSQGGGTFAASDIGFTNSGQWCAIHSYDGLTLTNCSVGPTSDNGIILRGGTNTLTNCTFNGVQNQSVYVSGGVTTVENCTWENNGSFLWTEGTDNSGSVTINGGSASRGAGTKENNGVRATGGPKVYLNNFSTDDLRGPIQHDFDSGNVYIEAHNCNFMNGRDSVVMGFYNNADYTTEMKLYDCVFEEQASYGGNVVVCDLRGNAATVSYYLENCLVKHMGANGSGLCAWTGGSITAVNTVIKGSNLGILSTTEGVPTPSSITLDHCVIGDTADLAVAVGDFAGSSATVRNTVIDSSCVNGVSIGASGTATLEYNMINVAGDNQGSPVYTGDPQFIDPANDDYHIAATSDCLGLGVVTDTLNDVDGQPYGSNPPVGIDALAGPADTTPPVISLLGDAVVYQALGSAYVDAGATASDETDGDISGNIVVGGDTVDVNTAGTYVITYNVQDAAGNPAVEVTRTVIVAEDSDSDGLPDDWEMRYFGNLDQGPDDDPDHDGKTNMEELLDGTDPAVSDALPIGALAVLALGGALGLLGVRKQR